MPATEFEIRSADRLSEENSAEIRQPKKKNNRKNKRMKTPVKVLAVVMSVVAVLGGLYAFVVYSNIPFIKYWRTIWIETAMTTKSHTWLAEYFFPKDMIDEVMSAQQPLADVIGGEEHLIGVDKNEHTDPIWGDGTKYPTTSPAVDDILGQKYLVVGEKDYAGNTVIINDIEEGIVVSEIVGNGYRGEIMLVDDPSRVFLGMTQYPGDTGMRILDMMDHYGAVAAVNASGFQDPDENGNGGEVVGMSVSEGQYWGSYARYYSSMVLTTEDKLVVGNIQNWNSYGNIRDGIQFSPVLIANGEKLVNESSGYGIQPRTAIGQRDDGVIVFIVIDGRDPLNGILGCTVGDLADELLKYDVINASSCDGGATTALAYEDRLLNNNCSWNPEIGRLLPNAFMVRSKADAED
ncbi:MAG: phosphodiester glycosidase family protein [Clostridia bacterium]|nr:phosphodiester glycosidase family protein [Clostridia bacterium]